MLDFVKQDAEMKQIMEDWEREANQSLAKILLAVGFGSFLFPVLSWSHIITIAAGMLNICLIALVLIAVGFFAMMKKEKVGYLKYLQISFLLLAIFALNVLTGYKMWLLYSLPIIATARFYSIYLTFYSGSIASIFALLSAFCNAYYSPKLGIFDLNTVSFPVPNNTIPVHDYWLFGPLLKYGLDQKLILLNSLRLATLPNFIAIMLLTYGCILIIQHNRKVLMKVHEKSIIEGKLSAESQLRLDLEQNQLLLQEALENAEKTNLKLSEQVHITDALSKIYFATYYVDVRNDWYFRIDSPEDIKKTISEEGSATEAFYQYISLYVIPDYQEGMIQFTEMGTLSERLLHEQSVSHDYESKNRGWCRASWVAVIRDKVGRVDHALFVVAKLDEKTRAYHEDKRQLEQMNQKMSDKMSIIQALLDLFFATYLIDLENNTYTEVSTSPILQRDYPPRGIAQESLIRVCERYIAEESKAQMMEFIQLSTLNERMKEKNVISLDYVGVSTGWSRVSFISGDRNEDGTLKTVIWCVREMHQDK